MAKSAAIIVVSSIGIAVVIAAVIGIVVYFNSKGDDGSGSTDYSCGTRCKLGCQPDRVFGTGDAAKKCCNKDTDLSNLENCIDPIRVDAVMAYGDKEFRGDQMKRYGVGTHTSVMGGISSLRIPPGMKVEAYNTNDYRNSEETESKVYTEDVSHLGDYNDKIKVMRVSKV